MDIRKLQRIVVDALEDVKGQDIKVFNTSGITGLFDRIVIASGTSNRQTRALAASVRDKVKQAGGNIISVEGEETGEWVLVDLGDAVVHIMQPPIRSYYNLEELWGLKPVSMKTARELAGSPPAKTSAVTGASAGAPSEAAAVGAKRRATSKAPRKTAASLDPPRNAAGRPTDAAAGGAPTEESPPKAATAARRKVGGKSAGRVGGNASAKTGRKTVAKNAPA